MNYKIEKLKDVADIIRGVSFSKDEATTSEKENTLPIIRAGSIQKELLINYDNLWIAQDKVKLHQIIKKDDIIMCTSSGSADLVGKTARATTDWKGSFGAFCTGIRPKIGKCNASFLFHFLQSPTFRNWTQLSSGANIKNIRVSELGDFKIQFPALPTQTKIAQILDKADQIRQKRKKAIELADEFLRSLFLEMFGDPVVNPKGWKVDILNNLTSKIGSGSTPKGGDAIYINEGISLIRSLNVHDNIFIMKNLAYIDDAQANKLKNVTVEKNDVLINITGASVTRCCIVPNQILPARVNQHVSILRLTEKILPEFLVMLLICEPMKRRLLDNSGSGATREALTKQQLQELEIIVPPIDKQQKFVDIYLKISNLKNKIETSKTDELFNSLSQQYFTKVE